MLRFPRGQGLIAQHLDRHRRTPELLDRKACVARPLEDVAAEATDDEGGPKGLRPSPDLGADAVGELLRPEYRQREVSAGAEPVERGHAVGTALRAR